MKDSTESASSEKARTEGEEGLVTSWMALNNSYHLSVPLETLTEENPHPASHSVVGKVK